MLLVPMERPLDRQFGDKELAMVTSYLRWRLSSVVMLANIKRLLERLVRAKEKLGRGGSGQAWTRRSSGLRELLARTCSGGSPYDI